MQSFRLGWVLALSLGLVASATAQPGTPKPARRTADPPAEAAPAEALPATMTRVVFVNELPGLDPKSPDAGPKRLWRAGERWGRIEHPRNPKTKALPIVVVASPDAWFADGERRTVEYFRDPGPTYRFRAPIVDPSRKLSKGALPKALEDLEFGRELAFMRAHGAKAERKRSEKGDETDIYVAEIDGVRVLVSAEPGTRRVTNTVVFAGKQLLAAYEYQEYDEQVPTDASLFQPPADFKKVARSAKQAPAGKKSPK